MENDDLFDIIEPEDNQDKNADVPENDFVQDENFVNSLDFVNGFSDAEDDEIDKILSEANDLSSFTEDGTTEIDNIESSMTNEDSSDSSKDAASELFEMYNEDNKANGAVENTVNNIADVSADDNPDNSFSDGAEDDEASTEEDSEDSSDDEELDEEYEPSMIITEGTVITGNINTDCSLDVYGTINGDIFCNGKLSISGKVVGNSHATDVMINAHRIEGNIECAGVCKIGQNSVIIGDINAGAAVIAGAVKGTLDVHGPVILDSTSVIKGNIKAKSVQLINGAVLEGFCSLEYANSNVDEIFN